jgi:NitT/TauT family transport system substrate-binding protein
MTTRAQFLAAAGAVGAVAAVCPVGAQTPSTLRIALIPGDIAAQPYYAIDEGFFRRAGIEATITPITGGPAIASAVASGAVDIGYSNVVSLAVGHDRGLPFTIIAPANLHTTQVVTAGILTVLKSGPLRSARDLNGKTVAVNALNNISDVAVRDWMDTNGGDSRSLKFAEMPFPLMPEAVRAGRVDAASIDAANEQILSQPDGDLRRLADVFNAVASRFVVSVWFTTGAWIERNPALAKSFVTVMSQTAGWANANHAASAVILAKYLNKKTEDITAVTRVPYETRITPELVQPSIDVAVKYLGIKPFAAADFISAIAR